MKRLYASPGTCSICAHVALIETGAEFDVEYVTLRSPNSALPRVNPVGKVPTLVIESGEVITQNTVVLPFIADLNPRAGLLASDDPVLRRKTLQWLAFFNSDVHPALKMLAGAERYSSDPETVRATYTIILRGFFSFINDALAHSPWLTEAGFTVADIYGAAAFNWARFYGMEVADFPHYAAMSDRFEARPSVIFARAREAAFLAESTIRYRFMSDEWLAMVHEQLSTAISIDIRSQRLDFTVMERFRDVPADVPRPPAGEPGLTIRLRSGIVDVISGVDRAGTADVLIECDWAAAGRRATLKRGAELQALNDRLQAEEKLSITGQVGQAVQLLDLVHDKVADRTIDPGDL